MTIAHPRYTTGDLVLRGDHVTELGSDDVFTVAAIEDEIAIEAKGIHREWVPADTLELKRRATSGRENTTNAIARACLRHAHSWLERDVEGDATSIGRPAWPYVDSARIALDAVESRHPIADDWLDRALGDTPFGEVTETQFVDTMIAHLTREDTGP